MAFLKQLQQNVQRIISFAPMLPVPVPSFLGAESVQRAVRPR